MTTLIEDRRSDETTSAESIFAEVLADALHTHRVSVDSHFFDEVGADSLVMAHFCARVRNQDPTTAFRATESNLMSCAHLKTTANESPSAPGHGQTACLTPGCGRDRHRILSVEVGLPRCRSDAVGFQEFTPQ
jgi:hypothetical protein